MFKRFFGIFSRGTSRNRRTKIKRQRNFSFKRWFRRLTNVFRKKAKIITPRPTPVKPSITTIFMNKIKKSKLNVKDIELLEGFDANELKRRFSVTGSRAKILEGMIADYNRGKLSLPGLSHKSKFDSKSLDKARLNRMIQQYDEGKRSRHIKEARNNANILKKKFNMTSSQANKLQKLIGELEKGKGSNVKLVKNLLDPEKVTKKRVEKFIQRYQEGQKKNRGISYMKIRSQFSLAPSRLTFRI